MNLEPIFDLVFPDYRKQNLILDKAGTIDDLIDENSHYDVFVFVYSEIKETSSNLYFTWSQSIHNAF